VYIELRGHVTRFRRQTNHFVKTRVGTVCKKAFQTVPIRGKEIAIPLKAWTGPEGSRSLRLPDFNTIGT
jgi:hypothetical protein